MKKTVRGVVYDTDAMTVVKKVTSGAFGDPAGYEETLYVAENVFSVHERRRSVEVRIRKADIPFQGESRGVGKGKRMKKARTCALFVLRCVL